MKMLVGLGVLGLLVACGSNGGGGGGETDGTGGTGGSGGHKSQPVYAWAGTWDGTATQSNNTSWDLTVTFDSNNVTADGCGTAGLSTYSCAGNIVCNGPSGDKLSATIDWKTGICVSASDYVFTFVSSNEITFTCSFSGGTCAGTLKRFL